MEDKTSIRTQRAFSLIEFIGVLAVLAILAAIITPAIIKRVDLAAWNKETADLAAISNALTLEIVRNKAIPDQSSWAQVVADWTQMPVTNISTNPRRFNRIYLIDPTLQIAGGGLPYTQTNTGSVLCPTNARVVILSTIARSALPVYSGAASSYAAFNDIWNTPARSKPNNATWAAWSGTGDDLLIQRINFLPLFHQLILVNKDNTTTATFTIDNSTPKALPAQNGWGWNSYYLDGTVLGLNTNSAPQERNILTSSISYVFENGNWGNFDYYGPPGNTNLASNFSATAVNFLNSLLNPSAFQQGSHGNQQVDQSAALGSMLNFMLSWTMWANDNPHFNYYGQNDISKVQIWTLINTEGIGYPNKAGNVQYYTSAQYGLLQCK